MNYRYLCLVAVIKKPDAKDKKGLIDMNCRIFQDALNEVLARKWEQEAHSAGNEGQPSQPSQSSQPSQPQA